MTTDLKAFLPVIFLLLPVFAASQPTPLGAPEVLISNSDYFFMNPQFSPDGSKIAFTTQQYRGLWVADANGSQASQITGEAGAGYRFSWSPDGSHIVAAVTREEGPVRQFGIKLFDTASGGERQLTPFGRQVPPMPVFSGTGSEIRYRDGFGIVSVGSGIEPAAGDAVANATANPVAMPLENSIRIYHANSTEQELRPVPDAIYLRASVSPDGQKLAFEVYGGNLYISDMNGNNLIDLGRGEAPAWSPDSRYLSFMKTEDDGHDITGSDIYIVDAAGDSITNITGQSDLHAMNPAWSPDGSRIAFGDVQSGVIYQVRLQY
jgi:Tol biopolymer transport system component